MQMCVNIALSLISALYDLYRQQAFFSEYAQQLKSDSFTCIVRAVSLSHDPILGTSQYLEGPILRTFNQDREVLRQLTQAALVPKSLFSFPMNSSVNASPIIRINFQNRSLVYMVARRGVTCKPHQEASTSWSFLLVAYIHI